jgi:hypothetical protein
VAHLRIDRTEYDTLSSVVVEALATARGESATDLDLCLHDYLDPSALDRLYDHAAETDGTWRLEFGVEERDVTVRSDGSVVVE